ncbi:MAG: hypothetical protein K0R84_2151 [Clostridia bacterium]|jgi:hypothetical protein|nr:hypothetical protein [Clostridia bacterium]
MSYNRSRNKYVFYIIIVIIAGLASRRFRPLLPDWLAAYSGDVLWGLMVFLMVGFVLNKKSSLTVGAGAFAAAALVELSQLYHAPWIDSIRSYRLGGLILGYGFLWSDLLCYAAGILLGVLLEMSAVRNNR